jgi:hypothetical protein
LKNVFLTFCREHLALQRLQRRQEMEDLRLAQKLQKELEGGEESSGAVSPSFLLAQQLQREEGRATEESPSYLLAKRLQEEEERESPLDLVKELWKADEEEANLRMMQKLRAQDEEEQTQALLRAESRRRQHRVEPFQRKNHFRAPFRREREPEMTYEDMLALDDTIVKKAKVRVEEVANEFELKKEDEGREENCLVCLDAMKAEEKLVILACFHKFHKPCFEGWIKTGATKCPICNTEVQRK